MSNRQTKIAQAVEKLAAGNVRQAMQTCAQLLRADPADFEARHLKGRCHAALGEWTLAATEFGRAHALRPDFFRALLDLGVAQALSGKIQEALAALTRAERIDARPAELHFGLGLCAMEAGRWQDAVASFQAALARRPHWADALNNVGVVYDRLGDSVQALQYFRQAVIAKLRYGLALANLGDALVRQQQFTEATAVLREAAQCSPHDAGVAANLGLALLSTGDFLSASQALERALALEPRLAGAAVNLGEALRNLGEIGKSEAQFLAALSIREDLAEAHLGLGRLAAARGDTAAATERLLRAVELRSADPNIVLSTAGMLEGQGHLGPASAVLLRLESCSPGNADIHTASGKLLCRLGRYEAALDSYDRALTARPGDAQALVSRAQVLESLRRYPQAIVSLETARLPDDAAAVATIVSCAYRICDWDRVESGLTRLKALPDGLRALHPFLLLAADLSQAELAQALQLRDRPTQIAPKAVRRIDRTVDRLRIAYVSPDFREHPVAHCLAGVIHHHNRKAVTAIAVSLSAADTSDIGKRVRSSFDEFVDAAALSDLQIAKLMQEREVDIAIDLAGHTLGSRLGIFAQRAAPVQIGYLGFPGSTGREFMDYIVADATVIPKPDESFFCERVLRLPHCYLPFDDTRPEPGPCTRADAGLPPTGFVFCAFNGAHKITRAVFDTWLSLLHDVPDSILWLRNMGDDALARLRDAARTADVATNRLVVAPYVADANAHIARLSLADVFLDTMPYNAHSSAAEAFWAGVPVISCCGHTFAGRVGASIATAAGVPELIARDLEGYRSCALELATSPGKLSQLRQRLDDARFTSPLFDTAAYTQNLEDLLFQAHGEALARSR